MSVKLRLRLPGGTVELLTLPADSTLAELRAAAASRVPGGTFKLLAGFPPTPIDAGDGTSIGTWAGGTVVVVADAVPAPTPAHAPAKPAAAPGGSAGTPVAARPSRAAKDAAGPRIADEIARDAAAAAAASATAATRKRPRAAPAAPPVAPARRVGVASLHSPLPASAGTAWRSSQAHVLGGAGVEARVVPARGTHRGGPARGRRRANLGGGWAGGGGGESLEERLATAVSRGAPRGDATLDFLREAAQLALARQYDVARANARLASALAGSYELRPVAATRTVAGAASQLSVRFRVGRHWEDETVDNVPAAALVAVIKSIVGPAAAAAGGGGGDEDAAAAQRELLKPHMLSLVSPRQFWALVRFGGATMRRRLALAAGGGGLAAAGATGLREAAAAPAGAAAASAAHASAVGGEADPFDPNGAVAEGAAVDPAAALRALLPSVDWTYLTSRARRHSEKAVAAAAAAAAERAETEARRRRRLGLPAADALEAVVVVDLTGDDGNDGEAGVPPGGAPTAAVGEAALGPSIATLDTVVLAALAAGGRESVRASAAAAAALAAAVAAVGADAAGLGADTGAAQAEAAAPVRYLRAALRRLRAALAAAVAQQPSMSPADTGAAAGAAPGAAAQAAETLAAVADRAIAGVAAAIARAGSADDAFLPPPPPPAAASSSLLIATAAESATAAAAAESDDGDEGGGVGGAASTTLLCDACGRARVVSAAFPGAAALVAADIFTCGDNGVPASLAARGGCAAPDDDIVRLLCREDVAAACAAVGLDDAEAIASAAVPDDDAMLYSGPEDPVTAEFADVTAAGVGVRDAAAALCVPVAASPADGASGGGAHCAAPASAAQLRGWQAILARRMPPAAVLVIRCPVNADAAAEAASWELPTAVAASAPSTQSAHAAAAPPGHYRFRLRGYQLVAAAALMLLDAEATAESVPGSASVSAAAAGPLAAGPRLLGAWIGAQSHADAAVALLLTPEGWAAAAALARNWQSYVQTDLLVEWMTQVVESEAVVAALARARVTTPLDLCATPAVAIVRVLNDDGAAGAATGAAAAPDAARHGTATLADVRAWQERAAVLMAAHPWLGNVRSV